MAEGGVAAAAAASEEFLEEASEVSFHRRIVLVCHFVGDADICFCMPDQTEGVAYSVSGEGVLCSWRRTLSEAEAEAKRGVGAKCEEV